MLPESAQSLVGDDSIALDELIEHSLRYRRRSIGGSVRARAFRVEALIGVRTILRDVVSSSLDGHRLRSADVG